ncbi:hypothetical protein [uncultured Psychromonas sp.]|uniref:hypothetical protein n=1 Tax=uncultured Psychromonas sp. TaxID=173974 RepID=UPI00261273F7|nr:hypothetical protein [uncultured Psychromonas sp.]
MKIIEVLKDIDFQAEHNGYDSIADMHYKYRITSLDKPIVITFPPNRNDINTDPTISPFNFDFLCKYDVNIICFGVLGAHSDNYFMHPEFSQFIEKLGVALKPFKARLGYANSKGGFGIGAYAEALRLDYAILFHPISTKKLDLVPWDNRPTTKEAQHLDWTKKYNDISLGNCKGYIIYDPENKIDVMHANRFKNFKHVKINGFGHGTGYYFLAMNSNIIKEILSDFLYTQEINIQNLRQKTKLLRLTSAYYKPLIKKKPNNKILLKSEKKLSILLNSPLIQKTMTSKNLNKDEVDNIRDAALALEYIDLNKAMSLMKIALKLRPGGIFIKNKIMFYQKKLDARK